MADVDAHDSKDMALLSKVPGPVANLTSSVNSTLAPDSSLRNTTVRLSESRSASGG
jgi:hypothetical protein